MGKGMKDSVKELRITPDLEELALPTSGRSTAQHPTYEARRRARPQWPVLSTCHPEGARARGPRTTREDPRSAPEQDWNRSAAPDRRVRTGRLADALIESPRDARIVASRALPGGPRPIRREKSRRFFDSASPSGAVPSPPAPHRGFVVVALSDILQRPRPDITSLHHASLHLREGRAGSPRRTAAPHGFRPELLR